MQGPTWYRATLWRVPRQDHRQGRCERVAEFVRGLLEEIEEIMREPCYCHPPTEPGWYWYINKRSKKDVVEITLCAGELMAHGLIVVVAMWIRHLDGTWGPRVKEWTP